MADYYYGKTNQVKFRLAMEDKGRHIHKYNAVTAGISSDTGALLYIAKHFDKDFVTAFTSNGFSFIFDADDGRVFMSNAAIIDKDYCDIADSNERGWEDTQIGKYVDFSWVIEDACKESIGYALEEWVRSFNFNTAPMSTTVEDYIDIAAKRFGLDEESAKKLEHDAAEAIARFKDDFYNAVSDYCYCKVCDYYKDVLDEDGVRALWGLKTEGYRLGVTCNDDNTQFNAGFLYNCHEWSGLKESNNGYYLTFGSPTTGKAINIRFSNQEEFLKEVNLIKENVKSSPEHFNLEAMQLTCLGKGDGVDPSAIFSANMDGNLEVALKRAGIYDEIFEDPDVRVEGFVTRTYADAVLQLNVFKHSGEPFADYEPYTVNVRLTDKEREYIMQQTQKGYDKGAKNVKQNANVSIEHD